MKFKCVELKDRLQLIYSQDRDLAIKIDNQQGFLSQDDVEPLIKVARLMEVSVRCGGGRFVTSIQNLNHFVNIIEEHSKLLEEKTGKPSGDYIRDVSL